jgi:hypothetical protein
MVRTTFFGISLSILVVRDMSNPFCVPGYTTDEPGPLNPWKEQSHKDYYVSVDHTEQAFQNFVQNFTSWNVPSNGAAVLVHGEDGCGKTSLIHRCTAMSSELFDKSSYVVEIVDRSEERLDGYPIIRKCEDVVNAVLRDIRLANNFLPANVLDRLPSLPAQVEENDLRRVMDDVAAYLRKTKRILIIIPPKIELFEELQLYVSVFTRGSLLVIMESNDEGVRQSVERLNKNPKSRRILTLGVGPLEPEQGWAFVQARMQIATGGQAVPVFDPKAVNKYMRNRCHHARVSIRELERVCTRLYEDAKTQAKLQIDYSAFCEFWVRYGGGIG